jgi:hypothetical protein
MPSTPPITGPHQFAASSSQSAEAIAASALAFIAQRMAGIEWLLTELNDKMFKVQTDLSQINHKTRP